MTGKEKIYFLVDAIDDARAITPKGQYLIIDPTNDLNRQYRDVELKQLFTKLEKDEGVLNLIQIPSRFREIDEVEDLDPYDKIDDGCYHIKLLSAFDKYLLKIKQEPEYQKFTGKTPLVQQTIKPSRKALEKIWEILQEIEDKRGIRPIGDDIPVQQAHLSKTLNGREAQNASDERLSILKKLEEEEAVENIQWPKGFHQFGYLKIGKRYFDIFDFYKLEYEKVAKDYQQNHKQEEIKVNDTDIAYKVRYSEQSRKIVINNFLIKQTRSFSENDSIFAYLYKNPNEDKSDEDIKAETGLKAIKDLNKFIENIGFKGDLRKVFFKVSKSRIRFNNPITKGQLKELGIEELELQ